MTCWHLQINFILVAYALTRSSRIHANPFQRVYASAASAQRINALKRVRMNA